MVIWENIIIEFQEYEKEVVKQSNLPQVRDTRNYLGLFGLVLVASGSILLGLNRKKRKRNKND